MYQIPRTALVLILTAQAMVILPHLLRLPVWLTLLCVGCGAWRVMVFQGRWRYPGRLVKTAFVFGGFVAVGFGYGTLLGLEPWVGILITAFALKLLEMHQQRDVYTVVILAYFVALTEFLFEQSIPYTLYIYLCITVITGTLIALNQNEMNIKPLATLKRASVMLAQAIPLMIVLFVLFPRIAPLWTVPIQSNIARTGVSDTMSPGDIAQLVQSDDLAFRATFEGDIPPYRDLYWRGLVLSFFDGKTQSWTQERTYFYREVWRDGGDRPGWAEQGERLGREVKYNIIMEPTNQNWLFSLTLPDLVEDRSMAMILDYRFYAYNPVTSRFRYDLTSHLDFRIDAELSDFWRYRNTLIPEQGNPRSRELAGAIRSQSETDEEFVQNVQRLFATGGYAYTLRPPMVSGDTIDEFLFETRRGFCEHFAGSFVYLMRAGGVPARVVVGYQGGEYNRLGNYVAVHQFDAHAWVEVWFEGRGWVRVDPTSVVAPERISEGLERAVAGEQSFLADAGLSLMKFRSNYWITELRLQISSLNYYWDTWIVGYTPSVQMSLLTRYLGDVDRKTIGVILLSCFFGLLGIIAGVLLLKRSQRKLSAVDREYLKFCNLFEKRGLGRRFGEGPIDYARRLLLARPDLEEPVGAVTRAYIRACFIDDTPGDVFELKQAVRRLRTA